MIFLEKIINNPRKIFLNMKQEAPANRPSKVSHKLYARVKYSFLFSDGQLWIDLCAGCAFIM